MRFNHSIRFILAVGAIALTNGCGWIKDSPKTTQTFSSKAFDLTCMNTAPAKLQNLFDGDYTNSAADQAEIKSIWDCLDHGLNTFSAYTRGSNSNYYTSAELQQFANRYLPSEKPLDADFVKAIFRLKMAVIGGSETSINRVEIDQLRRKLNLFGQIIQPLSPYIKVLLAPTATTTDATRKAASVELNRFVLSLADVLGDSANDVQWTDLLNFVWELERYTKKEQRSALTFLREELPLIQYFKLLIVGGSETSIEKTKWNPIFQSISHVYDAICLTSSNVELLQHLGFDVQSTEAEQKRAITALIETFKLLKPDLNLESHKQIELMSDRFAQLLLVNSVLFPRSQGSLALKPFLSTESMRTLTAYILDDIPGIKTRTPDQQANLQTLVEHVDALLDQASISNSIQNGTATPLSLSSLQDYVQQLRPLFAKDSEADTIIAALKTMRDAIPVLTGRDPDHLTVKDLKNLIQKGLDGYIVWGGFAPKDMNEKIGATLDILIREPVASTIIARQASTVVDEIKDLMVKLELTNSVNWDGIKKWIDKGFKTKAVLFQNSEMSVSSYELSQLAYLWDPFRRNSDLSVALAATANLLANRPFADVKITDLISVANTYMAEGHTISDMGLSPVVIGDLKVLLAGGAKDTISGQDYSKLARAFSKIYAQIGPKLKALPANFAAGFNSTTVDLAEAFIEGFIDAKTTDIDLGDLKTLLVDLTKGSNYAVRDSTINTTLAGIYTRVLANSKGAKPATVNGLKFKAEKFNVLIPLLDQIRVQLADIEKAYAGLDITTQTLSRATLLSRVQIVNNRTIIQKIQPLLDGTVHLHHFPKKGAPRDQYFEFDLAYKTAIYSIMNWITPFYKVTADPLGSPIRLAEKDMTDLLTDINDLIFDLKLSLSNSSAAAAAKARLQNMNIFTQVGNGDEYMEPLEAVEFLTITFGGKVLFSKVQNAIFSQCFPAGTNYDLVKKIPYSCLSRVAFTPAFMKDIYAPVVPQLVDQYLTYTPADLETYRKASFTATRAGWTETGFMSIDDFETFVSLPYFLENIFERFDVNFDDTLRFSELMTAFPVFCQEINKASGGKLKGSCVPGEDPRQIEAVYGYLIYNGRPPTGTEPGNNLFRRIRAYAEMLAWFNRWNHLNRDPAVRDQLVPILGRQDLLSIISNLSSSTADADASPGVDLVLPESNASF